MPEARDAAEVDEGTSSVNIVGGETAKAGDFPFIVSLSGYDGWHFCGGSLVNANTVITAAHCSTLPVEALHVRAGSLKWQSGGVQVGVSQIVVHENYSVPYFSANDVALWRLSTPIRTSSTISYVKLPSQGSDPAGGLSAVTAGWGYTMEGNGYLPDSLLKVSVPIVSRAPCQAAYKDDVVGPDMICAGLAAGGKDACQGDSGGPIVEVSTKTLLGLTSWGYGCARANAYGVYTNIGAIVSWINAHKW
ncbi:trypsin-like cysteine/serine peptidase domain-containing protein [Microdochium trichocladiopsis]|uniref:Trypsin-like cysteine/serine peptidase domain-containing protein n=1 Tax=Microdochium trichocladiopsis TaxID=1682393 RepID=A0A9P9BLX8_9PEZI|nr:trypsin-like cysteine/serine peptidase domain-containing protein [Microdochium trichocladiopsis]KAH7024880.1 trypsin-like cysteine/serine peptidase domain-containing protein [Microdochium trichocladiopsis]